MKLFAKTVAVYLSALALVALLTLLFWEQVSMFGLAVVYATAGSGDGRLFAAIFMAFAAFLIVLVPVSIMIAALFSDSGAAEAQRRLEAKQKTETEVND